MTWMDVFFWQYSNPKTYFFLMGILLLAMLLGTYVWGSFVDWLFRDPPKEFPFN